MAEVLSPSTADFDQHEKLEEYRTVPSLRHILIIDPDQPRLRLHSRSAEGPGSPHPMRGWRRWWTFPRSASPCRWPSFTKA